MYLHEAFDDTKNIEVAFKKGKLSVTYVPAQYTPEQIDELQREDDSESKARKMARMAAEMIASWDLKRADGSVIETDAETLYSQVPAPLLSAVMQAVQKDQSAGEGDAS